MHRMGTKRDGSWSNDRDKARSLARSGGSSDSPLLSVVLLLRYCISRCYQCHSVAHLCYVRTCSRTHPLPLLVILTRAPASEWAGLFCARVGGPRYKVEAARAACGNDTRSVGPRTVRKHAPEGPRITRCFFMPKNPSLRPPPLAHVESTSKKKNCSCTVDTKWAVGRGEEASIQPSPKTGNLYVALTCQVYVYL